MIKTHFAELLSVPGILGKAQIYAPRKQDISIGENLRWARIAVCGQGLCPALRHRCRYDRHLSQVKPHNDPPTTAKNGERWVCTVAKSVPACVLVHGKRRC